MASTTHDSDVTDRLSQEESQEQPLSQEELQHDDETVERVKRLPRTVGVVLMTVGVVGLIIPGPIGTPFLIAGGLVLAPGVFGKLDKRMRNRKSKARHKGVSFMERFLADMDKRFPPEEG